MVARPLLTPRGALARQNQRGDDLVATLMRDGAYGSALAILSPQIAAGTADPVMLDQAATCHWQLEQADDAMALLQHIIDGHPNTGGACVKLASYALGAGDRDRAHHALQTAFDRGVRSAQALSLWNRLCPIPRNSAHARRLRALAATPRLPTLDRAMAQNTLGKIEDRAGRYRAAFRWFTLAKDTYGPDADRRGISALVAAQVLKFDPARMPSDQTDGRRFLFITGMPRSGTTVLEHSLSCHSQIRALGENPGLSQTARAVRRHIQSPGAWDWFDHIHRLDRDRYRQLFLSYLPPDARDGDQLILCKMPFDCFDMGVAVWLWPTARFVHMSRHPLDVGLSNVSTLFHQGHGYSRRLDWMAHMMRAVATSAKDYRDKLGPAVRMQSYRALVESPEDELRAILTHANLPWEAACLNLGHSVRPVQTASVGQLGTGFHCDGLNRWRRYADQLRPLHDALGADWMRDWDREDVS